MKIVRLSVLVAIATLSFNSNAQEKKEQEKPVAEKSAPVQSNGNAEAMRRNLNYPNAVNPATNNNQKYDKGKGRVESSHPENNLSNSYNRKQIEPKK